MEKYSYVYIVRRWFDFCKISRTPSVRFDTNQRQVGHKTNKNGHDVVKIKFDKRQHKLKIEVRKSRSIESDAIALFSNKCGALWRNMTLPHIWANYAGLLCIQLPPSEFHSIPDHFIWSSSRERNGKHSSVTLNVSERRNSTGSGLFTLNARTST
jgi:hypothetical protein